jgi:flagellar assembly factor FliW
MVNFKIVSPILGFDSIKEITFSEVDDFFSTLEKEGVAFTLIDPSRLREYSFEIPLFYKKLLEIEEGDDVRVYNTMIVDSVIENSRINFAAPLILNHTKKLLAQVALDSVKYPQFGMAEPISDYL